MSINVTTLNSREEWLEHRRKYIGGSEASAIVGMNPYMSNLELWQIKTGQIIPDDISEKPYVKYGTAAEAHLRELFKLDFPQYEILYEENNTWWNARYPWAAASLDGWLIEKDTSRKGVLEIKTTNILWSMQKEKWNNRIPDNYYIQLLHYLMVTGFEFAVLKAQLKTEINGEVYLQTKHYHVEAKEVKEDIDYLMNEERKFWKFVQMKKRPALLLPAI